VAAHNLRMDKYGKDVGSVTFPIRTPGDMVRIRLSAHYRSRNAADGWDVMVSFDKGGTWKKLDRFGGPIVATCKSTLCEEIPEGTREALVKFVGSQRNTTCIFDLRIDADYVEPAGGFRPVKVTYLWTEGGKQKQDVHIAKSPGETWEITCGNSPVMKSFIVELAD